MYNLQRWKDCGLLFFLCLWLFFLFSGRLSITDPTECNYALAAREMLLSEEYLTPRLYGGEWFDKPILFYWELIAAFKLMGINNGAARFFPAVFATAGVFLTYFFGSWLYGRKHGLTAAVILMTSLEYFYLARAIITDMTLFSAISTTLIAFYVGYQKKNPRYYYLAYATAGIAVLTKGPIGLCLPGLIILLFLGCQRDFAHLFRMRLVSGMVLFLVIVSIWYLPMLFLHGWAFIDTFFGVHNVLRATVSEHPAQNVWYYYILIFLGGFTPWVFPVLGTCFRQFRRGWAWKLPRLETHEKFLWVWALTVPAVFQCFATKYLTYTLPYMLPVAILFAGYYMKRERLMRRMALGCVVVLSLAFWLIAVPLCDQNSGRREGEALQAFANQNLCVAAYRNPYSASLAFYSGMEILRVEREADIEHLKPKRMSWNSLNRMPFMPLENMATNRPLLVIVSNEREEGFLAFAKGAWEVVKILPGSKFYLRKTCY